MRDWQRLREEHLLDEDEGVLAFNKPAGISVTGERHDTDMVRLAADAGERLYPVHRIDKATSGLVLFAKDLQHHAPLTRQFNKRTVDKQYLAVVAGQAPDHGTVDLPLSVGRKNRVRVAAAREAITSRDGRWFVAESDRFTHVDTYPSVTEFERLWTDGARSLLAVRPTTGRRHQIRVHLAWIGFAVVGDPLFDKRAQTRTRLHSFRLALQVPWRGERDTAWEAPPGADFWDGMPDVDIKGLLSRARDQACRRRLRWSLSRPSAPGALRWCFTCPTTTTRVTGSHVSTIIRGRRRCRPTIRSWRSSAS